MNIQALLNLHVPSLLRFMMLGILIANSSSFVFAKQDSKPRLNEKAAKEALDYLAARLQHSRLNRRTGSEGEAVTTAIAGLAFLASGSTFSKGSYATSIQECFKRVALWDGIKLQKKGVWDQSTWGYAYGVLFLSELNIRDPRPEVKKLLASYAGELAARQTKMGSWCHGRAGPCAARYHEFNGVGLTCMMGLGLAGKAGYTVPKNIVTQGITYITQSTNPQGGVTYSTRPGQNRIGEAGRSASALIAYHFLGKEKDELYAKFAGFLAANIPNLEAGHGSPLCHLLSGALACRQHSKVAWNRFERSWFRRIITRQKKDGSIGSPNREDFKKLEVDRATATQALILCIPLNNFSFLPKHDEKAKAMESTQKEQDAKVVRDPRGIAAHRRTVATWSSMMFKLVALDLEKATFKQAITQLSKKTGLKISLSPEVQKIGSTQIKLGKMNVNVRAALKLLALQTDTQWKLVNGQVIYSVKKMKK